jgi:spermidine/putrescine transport system substrate-binding protein
MSEREERLSVDPARMQRIMKDRLTRRSFLRGAGTGAAGISLAAILAACGEDGGGGGGAGDGGSTMDPVEIFSGQDPEQRVEFGNWPLYIDRAKDKDGNVYNPSLRQFTQETGIAVNYQEDINSNEEFFAKIQPQLAAGDSIGYDIVVITNGRYLKALIENGWVLPLDPAKRPNFDANAAGWAKDPAFDPGNAYTMAWQSGITGLAVNRDLVSGEITKMEDLLDPSKLPADSVGMIPGDAPEWVMINMGLDPVTSGPEEWQQAADWLAELKAGPTFRKFYDQNYTSDMTEGNVAVTMAWSGDVLYYAQWAGYENLEFVFPEGGALLWIDNQMIPATAEHPVSAYTLMDYVYKPDVATMITEWVLYMSPVSETQELILADAQKAEDQGYKGYANKLYATAKSPYLYPSDEFLARTSFGFNAWNDDTAEEWDAIFNPVLYG